MSYREKTQGYDSTWSEVENLLTFDANRIVHQSESDTQIAGHARKYRMLVRYFTQVKSHFGVIGVVLLNNMYLDRENIASKFVHDGVAVQDALKTLDFEMIRFIF